MTRKDALKIAVESLEKAGNKEAVDIISEMIEELPCCHWSKNTCFDAINQWISEHNGKAPSPTEFDRSPLLPSHAAIKNRFGIPLSVFMKKYYNDTRPFFIYNGKDGQEWVEVFKNTYLQIKPISGYAYNMEKPKYDPRWQRIAKHLDVDSWLDLITILKLPIFDPVRTEKDVFFVEEEGGLANLNKAIMELSE